jgi:hypothetical protein
VTIDRDYCQSDDGGSNEVWEYFEVRDMVGDIVGDMVGDLTWG